MILKHDYILIDEPNSYTSYLTDLGRIYMQGDENGRTYEISEQDFIYELNMLFIAMNEHDIGSVCQN